MTDIEEPRIIVVDYKLSAPPEKVWRALTEPELLERWLMPNDIAPIVGRTFTFRTAPAPGFDGIVHCRVEEMEAPERLVYSWRGGAIDTMVTWALLGTDAGGTYLRLVQDGFGPDDGFTYDILARGWREKAEGSLERVSSTLA
ncbi:MAG: hypothetical protein JWN43_666 [Gammaproteobacteria bacterium]|nr:hypothetical protein [Gammaproteobacteria bacterium]